VPDPHPVLARPVLAYAGAPARWGIVCERNGPEVTITIPRRWPIGSLIFTAVMMVVSLVVVSFISRAAVVFAAVVVLFVTFGIGHVAAALLPTVPGLFRFSRPIIIELNAHSLTVHNFDPGTREDPTVPRERVYDIRYVPHSGNLVIHSRYLDLIECRPCPDPEVLKWMAETLMAALQDDAPRAHPVTTDHTLEPALHW
jgi:hypothetical protein